MAVFVSRNELLDRLLENQLSEAEAMEQKKKRLTLDLSIGKVRWLEEFVAPE